MGDSGALCYLYAIVPRLRLIVYSVIIIMLKLHVHKLCKILSFEKLHKKNSFNSQLRVITVEFFFQQEPGCYYKVVFVFPYSILISLVQLVT